MAFDFKKEYKEFYLPPQKPGIVRVPKANFLAVRGKGNPNEEGGDYAQALEMLYGVAYTIKMSYKGDHRIEGFYEYVVPPLEGFWWQEGVKGMDYANKEGLNWISLLRLPDFVAATDVAWAKESAGKRKGKDFSAVEFFVYEEGLCVQCMHIGPYDDEITTVAAMERYAEENGYAIAITDERYHHEIYLGDPRKSAPEKRRTVLRHPIAPRG